MPPETCFSGDSLLELAHPITGGLPPGDIRRGYALSRDPARPQRCA